MLIATCSTGSTGTNTKTETGISKPHRDLHRATERQGGSRPLGSRPTAPTPLGPGPAGHATPARPRHSGFPHAPLAWPRPRPHITRPLLHPSCVRPSPQPSPSIPSRVLRHRHPGPRRARRERRPSRPAPSPRGYRNFRRKPGDRTGDLPSPLPPIQLHAAPLERLFPLRQVRRGARWPAQVQPDTKQLRPHPRPLSTSNVACTPRAGTRSPTCTARGGGGGRGGL